MAAVLQSPALKYTLTKSLCLLGCAIVAGFAMFLAMQLMIRADGIFEKEDSERTYLNFVRVDTSDDVQTKKRKPPKEPPPPEPPPEAPDMSAQITNVNANLNMNMPSIGMSINSDGPFLGEVSKGAGLQGFDTDVIPVVRVPPAYPRKAKLAKLEGSSPPW